MMRLSYYESADPILDRFFKRKITSLDRPYAGYLFFLFGNSDANTAAWFSRNLLSLDALTGTSLAGVVFAQRVRTTARRVQSNCFGRHQEPPLEKGSDVDVRRLRRDGGLALAEQPSTFQERMVSRNLVAQYDPMEDITAITYGSHAVAEELGVLGDMPCIVLMDAYLSDSVDVIPLHGQNHDEVMLLLRRIAGRFADRTEYAEFFTRIALVHETKGRIEECEKRLNKALYWEKRRTDWILPKKMWRRMLIDALRRGRSKDFGRILRSAVQLGFDQDGRIRAFEQSAGSKLSQPSDIVLENELKALLPDTGSFIDQLERSMIVHLSPVVSAARAARDELAGLQAEMDAQVASLSECKVPQLRQAFREINAGTGVTIKSKKAGDGLVGWLSGWTKPDVVLKIGQFLMDHHPHFF